MNRRAFVKETQAPATLAEARDDLGKAMKLAHQHGTVIPCQEDPDSWTNDTLLFDGRGRLDAEEAAHICRTKCPVLAECAAFLDASVAAAVPLFGVVAGQITSPHHAALARRRNRKSA